MNDFGLLEKFTDYVNDINNLNENFKSLKNFIIAFVIFAILNIASILFNLYMQFKLKNKDKDIIKFNLRESERIKILIKLYELLEELTYYSDENQDEFINKTKDINKFITKNRLYLDKEYIRIATEFNDYFLTVIGDYRKKDYCKETKLLDGYSKLFNK